MNDTESEVETVGPTPTAAISLEGLIAQIDRAAVRDATGLSTDAPPRESSANRVKHVLFVLEETHYAVPLANVLEIQRLPRITSLPHAPAWLRGVTNMRGDVLSVVDLRMLLGIAPAEQSADERLVVVKSTTEDIAIGWVVDRVAGIRGIADGEAKPCSALMTGTVASFIQGIIQREGRLIAVLDVNRVLGSPELRQFELAS